ANTEQHAEQKPRDIFCSALSRYSSVGLRFSDRSIEKCLEFAKPVGDERAEFLIVRRHFEGRVDEKATAPLPIADRTIHNLLDELTNRLFCRQRGFQPLDPLP